MKRIYQDNFVIKKKNFLIRNLSIAGIYNAISHYGESYTRPLFVTIAVIIFSTFYFSSADFSDLTKIGICDTNRCYLVEGWIRAINAVLPLGNFVDNANWLDYVLRFIMFPISATSFIAIRRKFERRIRH